MNCAETLIYRALKRACASAGVLTAVFVAGSPLMAQLPIIDATTINYGVTPNQITISGQSFGTAAPVVLLETTTLSLVSNNSTSIVAKLPSGLAAGSYILTVSPQTLFQRSSCRPTGQLGRRDRREPQEPRVRQDQPAQRALPERLAPRVRQARPALRVLQDRRVR